MRPRRFLPSVSLLVAFEATLRTGSTTAAARDLALTQSTVSRLIQSLEDQMGRPLFVRRRKRLVPTEAALAFGREVSRALDLIQHASTTLVTNPDGGALALAILPTFGTRWLAPRLGGFLETHPGIALNFATRVPRFSFDDEPFDAVIFFGRPDWRGANHLKLFDEQITACAAPGFLARHPIGHVADMAGLPLLQLETRLDAWDAWFSAQAGTEAMGAGEARAGDAGRAGGRGGRAVLRGDGMVMDQFSMMIQAAISGLGVALLPDYLARIEIQEGRLAPVLTPRVPGTGSYWLAWPEERDRYAPLLAFRNWLTAEVAGG